jgi:hypothetical protein
VFIIIAVFNTAVGNDINMFAHIVLLWFTYLVLLVITSSSLRRHRNIFGKQLFISVSVYKHLCLTSRALPEEEYLLSERRSGLLCKTALNNFVLK